MIRIWVTRFSLACILLLSAVNLDPAGAEELQLSALLKEVQVALRDTQKIIADRSMPELAEVVLEIKSVHKDVGSGKIALFVVEVGGETGEEFASSVKLTLIPPSPDAPSDVGALGKLRQALVDGILAGAGAIDVAQKGKPRLNAKRLEIKLLFAIVKDAGGGISLAFPPFSGNVGGKVSETNVHRMMVRFEE